MYGFYDSKEAKRIIKAAIKQSTDDLNNTPRHMLDTSNPNHPNYDLHIFGYHCDELLAKQYKALASGQ